ncbi:MAG: cytochrome c family protein [Rhodospirillales bacterium]|nr:cytochrome c family protein [Rhodospirillales bacterium]
MDSMEVNKGIAAVLVAGIAFFLTGLIGDHLVHQTMLEKSVLKIAGVAATPAGGGAPKPVVLPPIAPVLVSASPAAGQAIAQRVCAVCHSFNEGGKPIVGPNLYNVVGGPHDHEAGFSYSAALEKFKGQPWTYEALNHWLYNPAEYAPGTRMGFAGFPNIKDRAEVIAYLRTLSHNPVPLPTPAEVKAAEAPPAAAAKPAPAAAAPAAAPAKPAAAPAAAAPGPAKAQ